MSAAALFLFDINYDLISSTDLETKIKKILGDSSIGTNIDLCTKEELRERSKIQKTTKSDIREWELFLGYYLDDNEFILFKDVVKLLLDNSKGDIYYYREPEAQREDSYSDAIELTVEDLAHYTPDMEDYNTYRILNS